MISGSDLSDAEADAMNADQLERIRSQQRMNRRLRRLQYMAFDDLVVLLQPGQSTDGDDHAH